MNANRFGLLALVVPLAWGCAKAPPGELVSVSTEPAGANCANGGEKIESGTDTNGNGTLDASEVTSTSYVCNGTDGTNGATGTNGSNGTNGTDATAFLTTTTTLDTGDATCADGGVRIDMGYDTNGDGTLEQSEITSTQYVCNDTPNFDVKPMDAPASPAGAYTVDASGGAGTAGDGGAGGSFAERFEDGTFGGHAKLFTTGRADASFTFPTDAVAALGPNPATVSVDTEVKVYQGNEPTTVGEVHTHGDGKLYIWEGDAGDVQATGLSVAADKTLTFDTGGQTGLTVDLPNDIDNAGTITTNVTGPIPPDLTLHAHAYRGEANSHIDLSGHVLGSNVGGRGGNLEIDATGWIVDEGDLNTSGADGTVGGFPGTITLDAGQYVADTGSILAYGGAATAGDGADGAQVLVEVSDGHIWTSGPIDVHGANGTASGGGGGEVTFKDLPSAYFTTHGVAEVLTSSDVSAYGGDATDAAAGKGGLVDLEAAGGKLVSTGTIDVSGGVSTSAAGGGGGKITFTSTNGELGHTEYIPGGDIRVSGALTARGGDGADGGDGGTITADSADDEAADSQEIVFLGYTGVDLVGGDGSADGGAGGSFGLYNDQPANAGGIAGPSGAAINQADVNAYGGTGSDGAGGAGGSVTLATDALFGTETRAEVALNTGALDVRGGDGTTAGGAGGGARLVGDDRAENDGSVMCGVGASTADGATQSLFGGLSVGSGVGPALNTGAVDGAGGDATGSGSMGQPGAMIQVLGLTSADNTGDLSVAGGGASMTDGTGGGGGFVDIHAPRGPATNSGTIDIAGGAGATTGAVGTVIIGDQDMTGSF